MAAGWTSGLAKGSRVKGTNNEGLDVFSVIEKIGWTLLWISSSCTIPLGWIQTTARGWEGKAERAAPEHPLPASMVEHGRGHVSTQSHAGHTQPTHRQVGQPSAPSRYKDHEFTISRCNRRQGILPYSAHS